MFESPAATTLKPMTNEKVDAFRDCMIFCFDEFVIKRKKQSFSGILNVLVATALDEASQRGGLPFQSVMVPPAPSITGTRARKSYGW